MPANEYWQRVQRVEDLLSLVAAIGERQQTILIHLYRNGSRETMAEQALQQGREIDRLRQQLAGEIRHADA